MSARVQDKDGALWTALKEREKKGPKSSETHSQGDRWKLEQLQSLADTLVYLQVAEETIYIQAPLLRVPVLVWADVLEAGVGKHGIVIF